MERLRSILPAAGVFSLALLVRIIYNMTVGKHYLVEYDAHYYYDLAVGMIKYHCYCSAANTPSIDRAPLWPFIMYGIFSVLGTTQEIYARLFLSVLGSGTCVIVYLFARDIFGRRFALITGAIAAVYPGLFINDGWLYSESVYTFFLIAFAYSLYRFQRRAQQSSSNDIRTSLRTPLQTLALYSWPLIAGISLALSAFTRPNGLLLLAVVFVWAGIVVWKKMIPRQIVMHGVVIITVVMVIMIAPWTWRTYTITHKIIPIAMGSGMVLTGAYNNTVLQGHDAGMWVPPNEVEPPAPNADSTSYSVHWVLGHVQDMPYLLSMHFLHTWEPYTPEPGLPFIEFPNQISSAIVYDMIWIMTPLVMLMALLGLILTWKRQQAHLLIAYLVLCTTVLQNIVFYGSSRFRSPIEPLLVLLVGGAIWWSTSKEPGTLYSFKSKRERRILAV